MCFLIYKREFNTKGNLSCTVKGRKKRGQQVKDNKAGNLSKVDLTALPDLLLMLARSSVLTRILLDIKP